jgi:hypothetical protein
VRPHERSYVEHLLKAGLDVVRIDGVEVTNTAIDQTLAAMQRGVPVIVQAALSHQGWNGRADILRRVEVPSTLGGWSYEPIDTKLARETKAGTILQLCHYADLLTKTQRLPPEYMYVVAPWSEFEPQQYRFADYAAYFRQVKKRLKRPWLPRMNAPAHQLSVFVRRWQAQCLCQPWPIAPVESSMANRVDAVEHVLWKNQGWSDTQQGSAACNHSRRGQHIESKPGEWQSLTKAIQSRDQISDRSKDAANLLIRL